MLAFIIVVCRYWSLLVYNMIKKYSNVVLISDLDGTLLDNDKKVSKKNIQAIEYFVDNGGRFGVATGRSRADASFFIKDVGLNFYSIYCNGVVLYDDIKSQNTKIDYLDNKVLTPFLQKCISEQKYIDIQLHTVDEMFMVSDKNYVDDEFMALHSNCEFIDFDKVLDKTWVKILFNVNEEQRDWVVKHSQEFVDQKYIERVDSHYCYYEFLPFGSNKGSMLKHMRQYLDKDDKIYVIGDYYNDIEMIKEADYGIAVENAADEVKKIAKFIVASNTDDAIYDTISNILILT